ncbi:cytochrome P450 [Brachybacterium saurashtrense]|uniref:Cytochrome P450 n=1 Tax=Brachybacterium saurashtrense TaxID=556288 RepID=A0A345YNE6_9MICO|nr:cytochrome P450 [Brachybacterium saurashtrense]AXK45448.1 cytochrome P450 [Brachybacterium saurashtrense]RRR21179.1 cytochrome P450 [Brachybacterium saurashtrense]
MSVPIFDPTGLEPRSATDELRAESPLARTPDGTWVVLRHAEAVRVAEDAENFSSAVSRFLQVPNGRDGAEHAAMRTATDPFFGPTEMARLAPRLRRVAAVLVDELLDGVGPEGTEVDAVAALGAVFAVRAQTSWLGWPAALETELLDWMVANHEASRSGDLARTAAVAERFDAIIRSVLAPRRSAGAEAPEDPTTALLRLEVELPDPAVPGSARRPLREEEIVSILRNWTGGDLGSIALCAGVLLMGLSRAPELVERVRDGSEAEAGAIVDELPRIDDPFVANRRVATCPVTLAGRRIAAGERVMLHWTSINRDELVVPAPDAVDPEANATANLVYGTGPHVCPGRPLATLELVTLLRELLAVAEVRPSDTPGEREVAAVGGWAHAPVVLVPRRR